MAIRLHFQATNRALPIKFQTEGQSIPVTFRNVQCVAVNTQAEPYTGAYVVTPRVDGQTLATTGKLMTDDVTIKAIPYYDTTNAAGGSTVYIASTLTE